MIFEDRIQVNPRLFRLKDPRTNEIVDFEIQDLLPEEIIQEGTEVGAEELNGQIVNEYSESTSNVYSADYSNNMLKVYPVTFSTGSIEPNADLYDKTKAITTNEISSDYTPIGIVGQSLVGGYYSHCFFSKLYVGGTNNRNIYWSIKNTFNTSIANLNCTIYVLAIKTTD